jgi:FtsZ-binding cell division protein ZapB
MSWYGGAPLKDAFNIIGQSSKRTPKAKDIDNPRDIEPNKIQKIDFEDNMKWVLQKYDNIIKTLQEEVHELKIKTNKFNNNNKNINNNRNNNIVEGFKNKSKHISFLSEEQINQIIFLIFGSVLFILALNCIFDLNGK